MAKKRIRVDRVIIIILVALLLLGGIGFGIYELFGLLFDKKSNDTNKNDIQVNETVKSTKLTLDEYTVYKDDSDELGFNFIVARIDFEANEPISFELKNLQTSEKIILSDISKYTNKLELANYSIGKLDISFLGISSKDNKTSAKILIPYETDSNILSVYNSLDASRLEFDLTTNVIPATSLKLSNDNQQIEVGSTRVSITNAYISDFMLHNDEQYELGSTQSVYSFEISISDTDDNVTITDATFIANGTNDEIHCLGSGYRAIDMDNIVDQKLHPGSKGGLFFVVHSSGSSVETGTLFIKFSNSDSWIEVTTN